MIKEKKQLGLADLLNVMMTANSKGNIRLAERLRDRLNDAIQVDIDIEDYKTLVKYYSER